MKSAIIVLGAVQLLLYMGIGNSDSPVTADYMTERKVECHFWNGTQRVHYIDRYFYNQEEYVLYDSEKGRCIAKTEQGRATANACNNDPDILAGKKAMVQTFCVYNYDIIHGFTADRRVQPKVKVSLLQQHEEDHAEYHIVQCDVYGFYPSRVEVKWYRNGQEVTEQAQSTNLLQNGDWTFQILVMLQTEIHKGDTFTCEVHHSSLKTPFRVDWHPEMSESAKHKMTTGIVGFILGAVLIAAGLFVYLRGRKVQMSLRGPQTESFIRT